MTERTVIDLTVEEETGWLAETRSKQILDFDGEEISVLQKYSREMITDAVASSLTRYPIGVYLDEEDLEYISTELVRVIEELDRFIPLFDEDDQLNQIRTYNQYRQRLLKVTNSILQEHNEDLEDLLGVPPEKELEEHAVVVGDRLLSSFSWFRDEAEAIPIKQLRHRKVSLGKEAIKSLLGPEDWSNFVRQDIRDSVFRYWYDDQNFREQRAREISDMLLSDAGPETIIEIYLKTLNRSERAQYSERLRRFIRGAEDILGLTPDFSNTLISQYIGHPGTVAQDAKYGQPSYGAAPADESTIDVSRDDIEAFEPEKEKRESGERLFLFSTVNQSDVFKEIVLNGVEQSVIEDFTDVPIDDQRSAIWTLSARGPPRGAAERMAPEDIALFYTENGLYTHRATIMAIRMAPELVASIKPELRRDQESEFDPRDVPRPIVVFLKDIKPVRIPSQELHSVLGYRRDYPTWNTVSTGRLRSIKEVYGGIEALLEILNQNSAM